MTLTYADNKMNILIKRGSYLRKGQESPTLDPEQPNGRVVAASKQNAQTASSTGEGIEQMLLSSPVLA